MLGFSPLSADPISAPVPNFPAPCPIDLSLAILDTDNSLVDDMVHCFPLALATASGTKDYVTGMMATTTGAVVIDSTPAGPAFASINPYGYTPAVSVDDLTDQLTIAVIAKTQIFNYAGYFGHLFSQHPAWFFTNQDYTSSVPTRFAIEVGGVEYTLNFADGGQAGDADMLHSYVATYDGANLKTYQDGLLINTTAVTGNLSNQVALNTRVGSYWGETGGPNTGQRDQVFVSLSRRAWTENEVYEFTDNPWQMFKLPDVAPIVSADTPLFTLANF